MVLCCNIFPSEKELTEMQIGVVVYIVGSIPRTEDRYEKLNHVARILSDAYHAPAASLTRGDEDYVIMLRPDVVRPKEMVEGRFPVEFIKEDTLEKYPGQAERIFYQVARRVLEERGLWKSRYNRYWEYMPEATRADVEIYRGVFFRFDVINDEVLLTADPITKITNGSSLWEIISKSGLENAKRNFIGRTMLVEHGTRKSICTLANIDELTPVTKESFEYKGKVYSVKKWLQEFNPSLAKKVLDKEPTITIYYDAKPYDTAPSLLKPILSTEETPTEVKGEIYLTAERRRKLTDKFLTYLNPLNLVNAPQIVFQKDDLTTQRQVGIKGPPALMFGRKKICETYDTNTERFKKAKAA